jgi:hypothetical protein
MADPIRKYIVTPHAVDQMKRRDIDETVLERVLSAPERRLPVRPGRDVLERVVDFHGRSYSCG